MANKFYTCSLRGVFAHVHAAVENDLTLFSAYAENSTKTFLTVCEGRGFCRALFSGEKWEMWNFL